MLKTQTQPLLQYATQLKIMLAGVVLLQTLKYSGSLLHNDVVKRGKELHLHLLLTHATIKLLFLCWVWFKLLGWKNYNRF